MQETLNLMKDKMQKSTDNLVGEFAALRAGRANTAILDKITVDYYGTPTPINQMASVNVTESRILQIQPFDPSILQDIERAINTAEIGINPQNDGKIIRLTFPPLTEDRRKDLTKTIGKMAEDSKISVRNHRREAMDKYKSMQKSSEITEDDLKNMEKQVQDSTDKFCKEIDDMAAKKSKEVMEI